MMTNSAILQKILNGIVNGNIVPYLGPGVLKGVTNTIDGSPIPADSESLILAMNNGTPMAPKLMYEFPRAAMNLELKKGRKFIERFLTTTYGEKPWTPSAFHKWLALANAPYIVDINRDTQLQQFYQDRPHTLIVGVARITASSYRFRLYSFAEGTYSEIQLEDVNPNLPILFKPAGTPMPEANYVASDADYVDYITELMGGFAIPAFLKEKRIGKQYVFLGTRMQRDTERMVLSDIIYSAGKPAGWALIPDPSDKEKKFCKKRGIEVIEADWSDLMNVSLATHGAEA